MDNRFIKILVSLVLALSLLFAFPGCSQRKKTAPAEQHTAAITEPESTAQPAAVSSASTPELSEAEHALFSDWFNYLQMEENHSKDFLWVLDHVEAVINTPDWSRLQQAHTVLETAALYMEKRTMPQTETTEDQYSLLEDHYGIDIYSVKTETTDYETSFLELLEIFRGDLQTSFFLETSREGMAEELLCYRGYCDANLAYDAALTMYLIQLFESSDQAVKLRAYVREYLPLIEAHMPEDSLSGKELESLGGEALDRAENALARLHELQGGTESTVRVMEAAYEKGDYSVLSSHSIHISGLSCVLESPDWFYGDTTVFAWLLDDGAAHRLPGELETLTENPTVLYVTCTDTEESELLQYINVLEREGYKGILEQDAGITKYYLIKDDWNMLVEWDGTTMTMDVTGNLPCFAPHWYVAM